MMALTNIEPPIRAALRYQVVLFAESLNSISETMNRMDGIFLSAGPWKEKSYSLPSLQQGAQQERNLPCVPSLLCCQRQVDSALSICFLHLLIDMPEAVSFMHSP